MIVEIENYRGWKICFNTETESFYAQSDEHDQRESKKSYSSAKQFVDNFIKDNSEFKPFWIEQVGREGSFSKVKVIGIGKDGIFVYENLNGKKEQLSKYYENNYILCNAENDKYYAELQDCKKRKDLIDAEIKVISAKIIKVGLADVKKKYLI